MKSKTKIFLLSLCILIMALILWTVWGNVTIKTTQIEILDENTPKSFDGFKIAQISDLHNAQFGKNNSKLTEILKSEKPDIIAITGDLVDSRHTDIETAVNFAKQASEIAPCYYVTGNHEARRKKEFESLETKLQACGVTVLRNETVQLKKGSNTVTLLGIDDPDFIQSDVLFDTSGGVITSEIDSVKATDSYKILLSHRPEAFEVYASKGVNLALCGHAHGGQIRLPFVGGIFAPGQGFFPKYDAGLYQKGKTSMVVSRGIGNSLFPVRVNNRPEIVIVRLKKA